MENNLESLMDTTLDMLLKFDSKQQDINYLNSYEGHMGFLRKQNIMVKVIPIDLFEYALIFDKNGHEISRRYFDYVCEREAVRGYD